MGRGELEEICDRYLSPREEQQKVTEAVERCLRKGYDYDKMKFEENKDNFKRSKKGRGRSRSRERSRKDKERAKDTDRDNRDKDRRPVTMRSTKRRSKK
ncbi:hypothetical protein ANCCAN_08473 [Ancylostoma caninum]|uniref:Uncharacterized protein n=1 Tax=Ancylostoma caninum TaxID=29170 RepID=A0A368GMD7_ANCCA|nr:hypothetical protein ANCCAN_08473 [Ancylostoma caninum]